MVEAFLASTSDNPKNYQEAIDGKEGDGWKKAIREELNSMEKNRVWDLVPRPRNEEIVGCRWIFTKKYLKGKIHYKARFVAQGFMESTTHLQEEIYSPVAKLTTIRMFVEIANKLNMYVAQLDIKTAFLNGKIDNKKPVYMEQPEGLGSQPGLICKLKKAIYGLKTLPKKWNECFHDFIVGTGFVRSDNDWCVYHRISGNKRVYLIIYVDDLLIAATHISELKEVQSKLINRFEMRDTGNLENFLGINFEWDKENGIVKVNQRKYILTLLNRYNMKECKTVSTPIECNLKLSKSEDMSKVTKKLNCELIGSLLYLAMGTRPGIAYAVNYLSRYQESPTDEMWKYLKRILRYLKGTAEYSLVYRRQSEESFSTLVGYSDADFGGDHVDRRSVSGYVFKLDGNVNTFHDL